MRNRRLPLSIWLGLTLVLASGIADAQRSLAADWEVLAVDAVGEDPSSPESDLLSLSLARDDQGARLRVGLTGGPRLDLEAWFSEGGELELRAERANGEDLGTWSISEATKRGALSAEEWTLRIPAGSELLGALEKSSVQAVRLVVLSRDRDGGERDRLEAAYPVTKVFEAHCAFVHHGNQGLAYSDVFGGAYGRESSSGFDEQLEVHEATGVPGNFHLSGTLITAAMWDHASGNPMDFVGWLQSGVSNGWAAMMSSAYAQHIMPFVQDPMNDWAVNVETQLVNQVFGWYPRTAWVPERVWLDPARYPQAGVVDWIGDDFLPHGVWAVVLDDDVHLSGWDNHQIHSIPNGLKIVPRDGAFTGNIVGGNGQGALDILSGLANSGVGEYRIAVYAEDWEAAAEMGFWADVTPYAQETYDWFVNKVATEPWIHAWRLDDALSNPNFAGAAIPQLNTGTYGEIGGGDGYGGGNNGWYTHWAGYVPYVTGGDGYGSCAGTGGNCRNYGAMWDAAYNKLMTVPSNNISEAGWYVMMTMLHETGWHDGLGGEISGWQHKYSAHVKNALIYAEGARWAGGEYAEPRGAFAADLDEDGYDELVLYNERIFACFEAVGGRAVDIFAKGSGYDFCAVGVDNAYWYGTEADYNDGNHVAAFSDVGPDHQHENYTWSIDSASGPTVQLSFEHASGLKKSFSLGTDEPWIRAIYRTAGPTQWIQTGMSPGLVDLIWNADMDRVWATDQAYMGRRNPNTGATVAYLLGDAGAAHEKEFSAQLMRGDEIRGTGTFEFHLYCGTTAEPVGGEFGELRALSDLLIDVLGPRVLSASYYPGTDRLRLELDHVVDPTQIDRSGFSVDDDGDGSPELTLDASTGILEPGPGQVMTLLLTPADAVALESLNTAALELLVQPSAMQDDNGVPAEPGPFPIAYGLDAAISADGLLESSEWGDSCIARLVDPLGDSAWTASNELDALIARWDEDYLYLAVDGLVTGNSWILYLDVDPGSGVGQGDLSAIDTWERGAVFLDPEFRPDFQYGAYQHQGAFDSQGFWRLDSPTQSTDLSDQVELGFDPSHLNGDDGGSELAIPWDLLYGLGGGQVPVGAEIGLYVSICWDPEPDGELGGDSIPDLLAATPPQVDSFWRIVVDGDDDGVPDAEDLTGPQIVEAMQAPTVGKAMSVTTVIEVVFDEPVDPATASDPGRYQLFETALPTNELVVQDAQPGIHDDWVTLIVDMPAYGADFTLRVTGMRDQSCHGNETALSETTLYITRVTDTPPAGLTRTRLLANVPNPFNPTTMLRFTVSNESARTELAIFDLRGRRVRTLLRDQDLEAGEYELPFDGRDALGRSLASGSYVVRLRHGSEVVSRKITLAK